MAGAASWRGGGLGARGGLGAALFAESAGASLAALAPQFGGGASLGQRVATIAAKLPGW
jgi:hypothetical protein